MGITTIGIDIAKNVFQVHGVDNEGNTVLWKKLRRNAVLPFFRKLESCLIGIEACGTAHHWARGLSALGHTVKLMPPTYVKPYVQGVRKTMPPMRKLFAKRSTDQLCDLSRSKMNPSRLSLCCIRRETC